MAAPVSDPNRPAAGRGRTNAWWHLAFILWLEAGYFLTLAAFLRLSIPAALWQAALCLLAGLPLLLGVVRALGIPKRMRSLPRRLFHLIGAVLALLQFVVPWLAWSALLWLLNPGLSAPRAAAAGAGIAAFSYLTGFALIAFLHPRPSDVEVTHHDVAIPDLPDAFDGYRILHLSDLHSGAFLSPQAVRARLDIAADTERDLVIFTGDLADRGAGRMAMTADALGGVRARDGTIAVLGNHDHWVGEERAISALSERGVTVLANSHLRLDRGGSAIYLAGVHDASYMARDDLEAALTGIPDSAPVILLSHAPEIVFQPLASRAALVLSGHTHGGQIVLPWLGPLYVPSPIGRSRAAGLHRLGRQWLFVNRGLGEVFPPIRINCPPQVVVLTLRRAATSV